MKRLHVRFFRSFNYDYERRAHPGRKETNWERIDGAWFPFIKVDLDPVVTAVVGANESGKTHLLDALERAITGEKIHRRDFCRYSSLFSVEVGRRRDPEFGLELIPESEEDLAAVVAAGLKTKINEGFLFVRMDGGVIGVVAGDKVKPLGAEIVESLEARLPVVFRLETEVPLPDTLSFDALVDRRPGPLSRRNKRMELLDSLDAASRADDGPDQHVPQIVEALSDAGEADQETLASEDLARRLLIDVAGIDPTRLGDLEEALREGEQGRANNLIEHMNRLLAQRLNLTRWWTQDRDFELRLTRGDHEVAFTVRDKTGTEYSFSERSRGLKFFLSYFVQLKVRRRAPDRLELLLMDEPDAYLSSRGQQDLLRTLEDFARPEGENARADQVVYVTHSPFLINKNAAHRIRVVDKGMEGEGTRVVKDAVRNHYEPLRSSIGTFVAETAFISGDNLLVEGTADQVLLAGMTGLLRHRGVVASKRLDLNQITIVPSGGAENVPYMAYLARGRDEIKPACVALFDGDKPGKDAADKLRDHEVAESRLLDSRYIVDLATWGEGADLAAGTSVTVMEDLIPVDVSVAALRAYAQNLMGKTDDEVKELKAAAIRRQLPNADGRTPKAVELAFGEAFGGAKIAKVGYAKEVIEWVEQHKDDARKPDGLPALEQNFGALIAYLAELLWEAGTKEEDRRQHDRLKREVDSFLAEHPDGATRDEANQSLRRVEAFLEDDQGGDLVRSAITNLRHQFSLATNPATAIGDFDAFRSRLEDLKTLKRIDANRTLVSN